MNTHHITLRIYRNKKFFISHYEKVTVPHIYFLLHSVRNSLGGFKGNVFMMVCLFSATRVYCEYLILVLLFQIFGPSAKTSLGNLILRQTASQYK